MILVLLNVCVCVCVCVCVFSCLVGFARASLDLDYLEINTFGVRRPEAQT